MTNELYKCLICGMESPWLDTTDRRHKHLELTHNFNPDKMDQEFAKYVVMMGFVQV